jgi:hypothetical protein
MRCIFIELSLIVSDLVHVRRSIFVGFFYERGPCAATAILYQSLNT